MICSPLDGKVFIPRRVTRKKKLAIMIPSVFLIYWLVFIVFGVTAEIPGLPDFKLAIITTSSIAAKREILLQLVNSTSNKDLFSQLIDSDDSFYDLERDVVGTASLQANEFQKQPYVANGYIGSRIPNLGQGFSFDQLTTEDSSNGWPLFNKRYSGAFIAGFYDIEERLNSTNFPELYENGYESVIVGIPQWTTLTLEVELEDKKYTLDPSEISQIGSITNYAQSLSFSDGIVTTEYTWLDTIHLKFTILAHRENINLGMVQLDVSNLGLEPVNITVTDVLSMNTTQRCQLENTGFDSQGIFINFHPHLLDYVNGSIYSVLTGDGAVYRSSSEFNSSQILVLKLDALESSIVSKFVGVVSSDLEKSELAVSLKSSETLDIAKKVATNNKPRKVISSHQKAWSNTRTNNISFNDTLLTLAARSSLYHLSANTRPDAQGISSAMGVPGLSSDSYGGMVFWDSDLWMMNGILPFLPSHARSFVNYRTHLHEQAQKNVPDGFGGAAYPWTSGRFGNCTSTGPCLDYEYHINMAVAQSAWQIYLSGAVDDVYLKEIAFPLINDAATFFAEYVVKYNETLGKYTTRNMTDPDEYANHVDNAAYTNAGISQVMKWAVIVGNHLNKLVLEEFLHISGNVFLPVSNNLDQITLEYSGMNASVGIKQADVIMLTYPLQNELIDSDQAYRNMEFYSRKQVSYGPAMTFPIFSIVASDLADSGCALQSYMRKGLSPFLRSFGQFSEQNNDIFLTNRGTHPAFPFMTAHGGFLQSIVQGLTGLRFEYEIVDSSLQRILKLDPVAIPCLGNYAKYEGIRYDNHSLVLENNGSHFNIINNGPIGFALDFIIVKVGSRNEKLGLHILKDGDTLTIPLYIPKKSYVGSVTECQDATFVNVTEGAYGDAPSLMNDGDNSTHWQSNLNNTVAKLLIDLHDYKNISRGLINWGDKPARILSLSVLRYNFSSTREVLGLVDFGNKVFEKYAYANPSGKIQDQLEAFEVLFRQKVYVTAPFDSEEYAEIAVPDRHNITTFDLQVEARFLLIEAEGIHNVESSDGDVGGSKFFEVAFYGQE